MQQTAQDKDELKLACEFTTVSQSVSRCGQRGKKGDFEDEKGNVSRFLKFAGVISRTERTETHPQLGHWLHFLFRDRKSVV